MNSSFLSLHSRKQLFPFRLCAWPVVSVFFFFFTTTSHRLLLIGGQIGLLSLRTAIDLGDGKLWIQSSLTLLRNWPCVASCPQGRSWVNTNTHASVRSAKVCEGTGLYYCPRKIHGWLIWTLCNVDTQLVLEPVSVVIDISYHLQ